MTNVKKVELERYGYSAIFERGWTNLDILI